MEHELNDFHLLYRLIEPAEKEIEVCSIFIFINQPVKIEISCNYALLCKVILWLIAITFSNYACSMSSGLSIKTSVSMCSIVLW